MTNLVFPNYNQQYPVNQYPQQSVAYAPNMQGMPPAMQGLDYDTLRLQAEARAKDNAVVQATRHYDTENPSDLFNKNILQPTLKGMIEEKMDYRGFIFFGIMLTKDGPKLLEYNVRLGDPETQAVLPLMDFDFADMCKAIINGTLKDFDFKWKDGFSCAPVAVSGGYPEEYKKGYEISINSETVEKTGTKIFIAGGKIENDKLVTSGGRVLAASSFGKTFDEAWQNSYKALEAVSFTDMFYRKDIGLPGAAESL